MEKYSNNSSSQPQFPWTAEEFHNNLEEDRKKSQEELLQDSLLRSREINRKDTGSRGNKAFQTYTFSQEEIDDRERRIKEDYRKSYIEKGKSEEEFEAYWQLRELEKQKLELERQRLKLEHELTIARQDRERRERIANFEQKQKNGEHISSGSALLYEIDKAFEELEKNQNR